MGKPGVFKRINGQDKNITPFKVYKSWRYDTTSSLDSDNIDRLVAIKPNPALYSGNKVTLDTWQRQLDSSSLLVNIANNKEASMIWYSLNHLYYKRAGQPFETFGYADPQAIERTIFNEASVISIPQKKFGETIKPGSVKLRFKNTQLNTVTMSLYDDGKGNLIDSALSASVSGEVLYLGFNSSTYSKTYLDTVYDTTNTIPSSSYAMVTGSTNFVPSGPASLGVTDQSGGSATWDSEFKARYTANSGAYYSELSPLQTFSPSNNTSRYAFLLSLNTAPTLISASFDNYTIYLLNSVTNNWFSKNTTAFTASFTSIFLSGNTSTNLDSDLVSSGWSASSNPTTIPIVNTITYLSSSIAYLPGSASLFTNLNERNEINNIYVDTLIPEYLINSKNVSITPNPLLTIGATKWGNAATFAGEGYIRLPNRDDVNFKQSQDYAVSFWASMAETGSGTTTLLSKRTSGTDTVFNSKLGIYTTVNVNYNISQYPFDITYNIGTKRLFAKQSTGAETVSISSILATTSSAHILLNKTGSRFELYINGALADSSNTPSLGNIYNNADIFIGSLGIDKDGNAVNGMYGDIDEFFIFNKGLTQSEITQLSYTGSENLMVTNTNAVGNVFYEHGMIVLSDPRPKYGTAQYRPFNDRVYNYLSEVTQSAYIDDFYLEYNSTVTLYEHEYVCKLKEDEFNFTSNPTIRLDNNPESDIPKAIIANSEFGPYITTVGLYTSFGELVAIGKLGTPIKKRDNVDLNLIVRFDI